MLYVVVGCGASALAHLYYEIKSSFGRGGGKEYIVIGEDDLWKKIANVDSKHPFGQPKQIVHVQGNQVTEKKPGFQNAGEINAQLDLMRNFLEEHRVKFFHDRVIKVERDGAKVRVKTVQLRSYDADCVIVATGFGRSSLPRSEFPLEVKNALESAGQWGLDSAHGMFQNRIIGGTEYLYDRSVKAPPAHHPFRVAVQGSSATSSWAVLRALALAKPKQKVEITWISRSGYGDANPAGRNSDVLRDAADNGWLTQATVKTIFKPDNAYHGIGLMLSPVGGERPARVEGTTLGQAYQNFYTNGLRKRREERAPTAGKIKIIDSDTLIFVDHFVYALGANPALPGGAGDILSGPLKEEMEPVIDTDKRFDDDPSATTLGFKTKDNKVWIVGAAAFRGGGIERLVGVGGKFANISAMMCEAGTPPEGIAAIIAGAKALNGWDENNSVRRISLQTADFMEIQNWFSTFYQTRTTRLPSSQTARAMTDQIVAMRKHTVFGLSPEEIDRLADPKNAFWNEMFGATPQGPHPIDVLAAHALR